MKKHWILVGCGAAVVVCVAAGIWAMRDGSSAPLPEPNTPVETAEYLASEQFARDKKEDRERFVEKMGSGQSSTPVLSLLMNPEISEEQRQKVIENVLPVVAPVINRRLDEFEGLDGAERTARLDALIDQMQAFRRDNPSGLSSAKRWNLMLQYVDPQTRARLRKHLPELQDRMRQRGLPVTGVF